MAESELKQKERRISELEVRVPGVVCGAPVLSFDCTLYEHESAIGYSYVIRHVLKIKFLVSCFDKYGMIRRTVLHFYFCLRISQAEVIVWSLGASPFLWPSPQDDVCMEWFEISFVGTVVGYADTIFF